MKFDDEPPDDAAVIQGLAALKRDGGTVLVVGAISTAHGHVCRRLLGEDAEEVLVRTDGTVRTDEGDTEPAVVIERPVATRSAAAATSTGPTDLGSLAEELREAMEELAADGADIRVCLDSLRPFVDTTDVPSLVSVLESIREVATETDAVVHFHLPAMPGAVPSAVFETVDAVVEVIQRGEQTYQQWYLGEDGPTTDWISV